MATSYSDARQYCPDDPEFFEKAPREIGSLISVHTSLSENDEPTSLANKLLKAGIIAGGIEFVLIVATIALIIFARRPDHPDPVGGMLALIGLCVFLSLLNVGIVFGVILFGADFVHFCGFVGEKGCAHFACSGSREKLVTDKMLLYEDAANLRIATTHNYYNGGYTGTNFSYAWTDKDEREVFSIVGAHGAEHDMPPETHLYHFAQEVEEAWSMYLLEKVCAKLEKGGSHKFRLSGSNYLVLGDDYLKLNLNGQTQEFSEDDLDEITIANGEISLKEPGAKKGWFTDTGIHVFGFAELSNARVFLLLLNRKFGIPIS